MAQASRYSNYIHCLHDETEPVGHIGQGTHYSVLRTVTWLGTNGDILPGPCFHDLAIIWDEDHDTRTADVLEALYLEGLLSPIIFVGERKGMMFFILASEFTTGKTAAEMYAYQAGVTTVMNRVVAKVSGDSFGSEFARWVDPLNNHRMLVNDRDRTKVDTYLQNIMNLWRLGIKQAKV